MVVPPYNFWDVFYTKTHVICLADALLVECFGNIIMSIIVSAKKVFRQCTTVVKVIV